jgi:hypothetical protein
MSDFDEMFIQFFIKFVNTLVAELSLRRRQSPSYLRILQHFMEPEGSLPCSQEPAIGPYPQPDQSGPYHPILSL